MTNDQLELLRLLRDDDDNGCGPPVRGESEREGWSGHEGGRDDARHTGGRFTAMTFDTSTGIYNDSTQVHLLLVLHTIYIVCLPDYGCGSEQVREFQDSVLEEGASLDGSDFEVF